MEALVVKVEVAEEVAAAYQMEVEADHVEETVLGSSFVEALVLQAAMTALGVHTAAVIQAALA